MGPITLTNFENLMSSKFVLAPGIGFDCYKLGSNQLGKIPVFETLNQQDGLFHAYDHWPVLWVNHFDNTCL